MAESGIRLKELERRVLCQRIKSYLWGIIVSVGLIIVTAVLVYFYPKLECNKRLLFLISSIWPSGVIIILVPMWTTFVRDLTENIGYDTYQLLQEEVSKRFADSSREGDILKHIIDRSEELQSTNKATRRKAFKDINEEINGCQNP